MSKMMVPSSAPALSPFTPSMNELFKVKFVTVVPRIDNS